MSHGNTQWDAHLEWISGIYGTAPSVATRPQTRSAAIGDDEADEANRREWTARPPGRLGRRLLADIELYLDFFATARS